MIQNMRKKWMVITGAFLIIIIFLAFVWPTPYRYDKYATSATQTMARTNRFTGGVQFLTRFGWTTREEYNQKKVEEELERENARLNKLSLQDDLGIFEGVKPAKIPKRSSQ